jgi:uncharacterized beta-barrel protein YwiB (DUF1934 family)
MENSMTSEVMVTLSGLHMADEEQDTVEVVHVGQYYERNGTHYILFEELLEGISQPVKNRIKIKEGYLEVQKRGSVSTNLIFTPGKAQCGTYEVPYGSFCVTICTTGIWFSEKEDQMEVKASYELIINGEHFADCDIQVRVESREYFHL